ncbi:hypothetical protein TMatcc_006080 [Talaromyces marneffei ATCC 18224]
MHSYWTVGLRFLGSELVQSIPAFRTMKSGWFSSRSCFITLRRSYVRCCRTSNCIEDWLIHRPLASFFDTRPQCIRRPGGFEKGKLS